MTWNETAPGRHQCRGELHIIWIDQIDPFDPYRWRRTVQLGNLADLQLADEYAGPLHEAKADMHKKIGRFGASIVRDSKAGILDVRRGVVPA